MGKKARSLAKIAKAAERKIDKSILPPPPPPPEEEKGSSKPIEASSLPGIGFKILGTDNLYDDGGVADLSLILDLEDSAQRRRRGENEYFTALKNDILPRATRGTLINMTRREQKVSLAKRLFNEEDDKLTNSEAYVDQVDGEEDKETLMLRAERVVDAKMALRLSLLLREPACVCMSLTEICKRILALEGKKGAKDALRCADKALEIAGDKFWDSDEIAMEKDTIPKPDPKHERNATAPGLAHPNTLRLLPIRVSHLCRRAALLQRGNALAALGNEEEARATYNQIFPLLENELRSARVDWERHSLHINVGNTYSRSGDFETANQHYDIAEQFGRDHLENEGSELAGKQMVSCAKRARAFALKKAGRVDEAKKLMKEVVEEQIRNNLEAEQKKKEEAEWEAAKREAAEKENPAGGFTGETAFVAS